MKLSRIDNGSAAFYCPGCEDYHVATNLWDIDFDTDTISPSLLVNEQNSPYHVDIFPTCHSFVRDGKIEYLSDCTHKLAGQTVELPDKML